MKTELDLFLSTKDYYCELHANFLRARECIFIIGWDIHSEVDLLPHVESEVPSKLHPFLNYIARKNPELKIYLLPWEYAFFYTLERDIFLEAKFNWQSPSNITLTTDGTVPIGGSHHQKIVVIDDSLVYCGGTDLTVHRWDDQEHLPHNPARVLLNGKHYPPYHELQVRCTGPLVEKFSKLVRERYLHVTGSEIPFACGPNPELIRTKECIPLPANNAQMLITKPQAIYGNEVRDIEKTYLQMIAGAKEYIYIETQYITSNTIRDALCARLEKDDCPEILLILPKTAGEWLELETMGRLQHDKCRDLVKADHHQRLSIVYPDDTRLPEHEYMVVHSKIMIVDFKQLIIGSANLTNRSMGVDSECCIYVEGDYREVFYQLVRVLSGVESNLLKRSFEQTPSFKALLKYIRSVGGPRSFRDFDLELKQHHVPSKLIPDLYYLDQLKPVSVDVQLRQYHQTVKHQWKFWQTFTVNWGLALTLLMVCVVTLLLENGSTKTALMQAVASPYTLAYMALIFFLCGMGFVSLNLLIVLIAPLFPTWKAFLYIMISSQFYFLSSYLAGGVLRLFKPLRFVPPKSGRVLRALKNNSLLTFVLIRIFPLAPGTAVGLVAGYIRAAFTKFQLGSTLGLIPSALALIYFQKSLIHLVQDYDWPSFIVLLLITMFLAGTYKQVRKRFAGYLN